MPITSSLGALTYTKFGGAGISDYWAIKGPTGTYSQYFYIDTSTESVYMVAGNIFSIKIGGFQNPIIQYNKQFYPSTASSATSINIKYNNITNELLVIGTTNIQYSPAFPNYIVQAGYIANIDKNTGTPINNDISYPYYGAPPSANNQLRKSYDDMIIDSSGNYYMVGYDTNYYGSGQFRAAASIWKFNSSFTSLASSIISDTTTDYFTSGQGVNKSSIILDSSENPIISYGYLNTNNSTSSRIILMKLNKTPVGSPDPYLPAIWKVGLIPSADGPYGCSKLLTDSMGNIYATYYNGGGNTAGYIIKYDPNGTILWQKLIGIDCQNMVIKNDNEIYIIGNSATALGFLVIVKIDSDGNLIFQRRIGPSSSSQGFGSGSSIGLHNNNMYITGIFNQTNATIRPILIKLPDDGSIPNTGTYIFNDGTTMTYASSAYSYANSNLTTFTPATGIDGTSNSLSARGIVTQTFSTTRSYSFL